MALKMVREGIETMGAILAKSLKVNNQDPVVKNTSMQTGSIVFVSSKKMVVSFVSAFALVPRLSLTLVNNTSAASPFSTAITKTGFQVNFQNNYTGTVEWIALERE